MPQWHSRIVGSGEIAPQDIQGHPENWRMHPQAQKDALSGALIEIGWIQQVVLNQRTGHLIDGHLRVVLALEAKEAVVPVLYVDLSEEEERLALLTLDPIAMLAEANKEALGGLLHQVQSGEAGLQAMLSQLAEDHGLVPTLENIPSEMRDVPRAQEQWIVAIECADEAEQVATLATLTEQGYQCRALIS